VMELGASKQNLTETRLSELQCIEQFDSLIIVNSDAVAEPSFDDIIEKTLTCVKCNGGNITVYTRLFEQASWLLKRFRSEKQYINFSMTETLLREHQIMDQRSHPLMQSEVQLFQGFIVTCIKVKA